MTVADHLLVSHLQSNDPQLVKNAWAAWYDRDRDAVRRALHRAGAADADVDDLTHEAFIVAVKGVQAPHFRYRHGRLARYVCVVGLNLLRAAWRSHRHELPLAALPHPPDGEPAWGPAALAARPAPSPDEQHAAHWLVEQVRTGLASLDPEERRLLLAHHLDGRTQRELAAERQVPISTVGVKLWRLRARLRSQGDLRRAWEVLAA